MVMGLENNGCGVQEQILVLYLWHIERWFVQYLWQLCAGHCDTSAKDKFHIFEMRLPFAWESQNWLRAQQSTPEEVIHYIPRADMCKQSTCLQTNKSQATTSHWKEIITWTWGELIETGLTSCGRFEFACETTNVERPLLQWVTTSQNWASILRNVKDCLSNHSKQTHFQL